MELTGYTSIFISYSHTNKLWMERFRKELHAALYGKAKVWCDEDIIEGTDWKDRLALELHRADVALVLATTDYLVSEWCRRELHYIWGKFREKTIKKVFWVMLEPCAWQRTELAGFQSKSLTLGRALSEYEDDRARDRAIMEIVDEIHSAVENITASLDPQLTFVQSILGDEAFQRQLSIESLISKKGDFAVVYRGRDSSQRDVAIKVLRRTPISSILNNLEATAKRRRELRDPGFIHLYDSFTVKSPPLDEYLVLVMEYFGGKRLSEAMSVEKLKDHFTTDRIVSLIRRAAEALRELHKLEFGPNSAGTEPSELGYGPMIPEHLFYDERLERLRFSSLSISNFVWDVLGWRQFAAFVSKDAEPYTAPVQKGEQPAGKKIDKCKLDQYMLGMLATKMLDHDLPIARDVTEDIGEKKAETFDKHLKNAGRWKSINPQLGRIVEKMLSDQEMLLDEQKSRCDGMEEIVEQLKLVEGEARALAKWSYMRWIYEDESFFKKFYDSFFHSDVGKRENSESKFPDKKQQHDNLRKAMAAVLNFYPGNEPTSLKYVLEVHRDKHVTEPEMNQFKSCFMKMLEDRLYRDMVPEDEMADCREAIYKAWNDLFDQVLHYFQEQGIGRRGERCLSGGSNPVA